MKDFRLDRKAEQKYILGVTESTKKVASKQGPIEIDTLSVKFASGKVFKNISYTEENLQKIINKQERQAKKGVEDIGVFKKRKTKAGLMTGASIIGGPVIGALATTTDLNPLTIAIGAGVITLGTFVPALYSLIKNSGKVAELEKIDYRDKNISELETYPQYENALVGLSTRKREWFEEMAEEGDDPFCITEIDSYSKKDLETIMENMGTENAYQFTYASNAQTGARK